MLCCICFMVGFYCNNAVLTKDQTRYIGGSFEFGDAKDFSFYDFTVFRYQIAPYFQQQFITVGHIVFIATWNTKSDLRKLIIILPKDHKLVVVVVVMVMVVVVEEAAAAVAVV